MTNKLENRPRSGLLFIISCSLCFAALAVGGLFTPGEWYDSLQRAPWNPPKIAFPIAWTFLYVLIAISGWILFKSRNPKLIAVWVIQLAVNASWSWIFFGQHWIFLGLITIAIIILLVGYLIKVSRAQRDIAFAGTLLMPYFLWLCLAFSLNLYIWLYN